MGIKPIMIYGAWDEGYALDIHTISSTFVGDNAYGYPEFDNEYSEMGGLLYQFKYRNKIDKLDDIIRLAEPFIKTWEALKTVDFVLPTPPSKNRSYQPAQEIAREIALMINAGYSNEILQKISPTASKDLTKEDKHQIQGSIIKTVKAVHEHNMLLVDDLYKSGSTLNECVRVLREDENIKKIYVLTMTKTRNE